MKTTGNLFIVTGPSGSGKTSLVESLTDIDTMVVRDVTYTTRAPRDGEVDCVDYNFIDTDTYARMLDQGEFLEHASIYGNNYGIGSHGIFDKINRGQDVILVLDIQGATTLSQITDAQTIFILPPSPQVLEQRLRGRGTDSAEVISARVARAKAEILYAQKCAFIIYNDQFYQALKDLKAIVKSERLKRINQVPRLHEIFQQFN
jgi:guanylate kinase